jgi:putative phosphoesterase
METIDVGIISDTHGLLRDSAVQALKGCSLIIHAGDVGTEDVLEQLRSIGEVIAVRGNTDTGRLAAVLPDSETVEIGDVVLHVLHDLLRLDQEPIASGFAAVISGHTHEPEISSKNGVYYLNPGSAGQRRFTLPLSVMLLRIEGKKLTPRIVHL